MTGKKLFEISLDLLGLKTTSQTNTRDTDDLLYRSLSLINVVVAENSILDCKIKKCAHTVNKIESLDDELGLSEIVESYVLPYALARLLILGEDDSLYSEMTRLYKTACENAIKFGKPEIKEITEVYK